MSRVIADGLSKRATATTQEAEAGTADKYPDAAGVHAAFNQYGLGAHLNNRRLVGGDANALTETGFAAAAGDCVNLPPGNTGASYDFTIKSRADGFVIQLAEDIRSDRIFKRYQEGGVWSDWREIFHTGNILGTVSQSAGVPTGAVIERGSNSNGEWTKFADGTMICAKTFTGVVTDTTIGSVYAKSLGPWTFPAAFAVPPRYIGSARTSANYLSGGVAGGTVLTSSVQDIVAFGARVDSNGDVYAATIGRWY